MKTPFCLAAACFLAWPAFLSCTAFRPAKPAGSAKISRDALKTWRKGPYEIDLVAHRTSIDASDDSRRFEYLILIDETPALEIPSTYTETQPSIKSRTAVHWSPDGRAAVIGENIGSENLEDAFIYVTFDGQSAKQGNYVVQKVKEDEFGLDERKKFARWKDGQPIVTSEPQ